MNPVQASTPTSGALEHFAPDPMLIGNDLDPGLTDPMTPMSADTGHSGAWSRAWPNASTGGAMAELTALRLKWVERLTARIHVR